MKFVFVVSVFMAYSIAGLGDQQTAAKSQSDQGFDWSTDLTTDYILGSRLIQSRDFGSQAVYHYELEVLRNIHLLMT
jgi:hypothetical protein